MDKERVGINNFIKYSSFYFIIAIISLGLIIIIDAVITPTYVFGGFIGATVLLGIYHLLNAYPPVQKTFGIVVHISIFILAIQEITGKLAMLVGICIATIVMAYWLKLY